MYGFWGQWPVFRYVRAARVISARLAFALVRATAEFVAPTRLMACLACECTYSFRNVRQEGVGLPPAGAGQLMGTAPSVASWPDPDGAQVRPGLGVAPRACQNSLIARWIRMYQMMLPISGSRNHSPHAAVIRGGSPSSV